MNIFFIKTVKRYILGSMPIKGYFAQIIKEITSLITNRILIEGWKEERGW